MPGIKDELELMGKKDFLHYYLRLCFGTVNFGDIASIGNSRFEYGKKTYEVKAGMYGALIVTEIEV